MLIGMGWLTLACVALGLGVTWFLPVFDAMTEQLLGQRISSASGDCSWAGTLRRHASQRHGIALDHRDWTPVLTGPGGLLVAIGGRRFGRKRGPVWDCGLPGLSEENEYTATAFSKALRMIFSALYKPRREIQAVFDVSPYFPKEIRFESEIEPTFEKRLYAPLQEFIFRSPAE